MRFIVARNTEDTDRAFAHLSNASTIGCDTETSGLSPSTGRLLSIQFSDGNLSVLVPVSEGANPGKLGQLLAEPRIVKIFHNARFDLGFLSTFEITNVFCTMLAEKVLTRGADQSSSLAETLYRYFGLDLDKSIRKKFARGWDGKWTDELVRYALSDVMYLPKLREEQVRWMEKLDLTSEYEESASELLSKARAHHR